MKRWHWFVLVVLVLIAGGGFWVWQNLTTFEVTKITDDVHVIAGAGGNVTVLKTGVGAVIVDSMTFKFQGRAIRERAEELAGEPVRIVISSHYHLDHTHGNPAFDADTRFIASEKTAEYLKRCDESYWQGMSGFPNELIGGAKTIKVGKKTLQLFMPGQGHTGGDLVVRLADDDVLVMGDLFFNRYYPNIDLEAGGSVRKWLATLDQVLSQPARHIVPGHGKVANVDDLKQFRVFIKELTEQAAAVAKKSEAEALKLAKLTTDTGYGVISIPFLLSLDRDFVVKRAWQEASGKVKAGGCPNG